MYQDLEEEETHGLDSMIVEATGQAPDFVADVFRHTALECRYVLDLALLPISSRTPLRFAQNLEIVAQGHTDLIRPRSAGMLELRVVLPSNDYGDDFEPCSKVARSRCGLQSSSRADIFILDENSTHFNWLKVVS